MVYRRGVSSDVGSARARARARARCAKGSSARAPARDADPGRGARRRRQDRAGARGARGGRAGRRDAARGEGFRARAAVAFGTVRQLLEPVIGEAPGRADLFAGAAGPAARLFEPDERQSPGADVGFEALHSLYWLVVNLADQPRCSSRSTIASGSIATRCGSWPTWRRASRGFGSRCCSPDAAGSAVDEGSLWAQVASRPEAGVLHPRPLSQSGSADLARERLGAEAAEEFCHACHRATGGNPLFLRELLGALHAGEVVPSAGAASEVQAVGPAAVSRFVRHRLARLGRAARELARAVAVLGDDSELQLAGRVSGLSEDAARAAADALVRADIFVRCRAPRVRSSDRSLGVVRGFAPGERQTRHAAAAEALAQERLRRSASSRISC